MFSLMTDDFRARTKRVWLLAYMRMLGVLLLLCVGTLWSQAALAACPASYSITVNAGQSATINVYDCFTFGVNNPSPPPQYGTVTVDNFAATNTNNVTYTNTQSATSDSFIITDGSSLQRTVYVTINPPPISVTPNAVSDATVGVMYAPTSFSATGGNAPYTYSISAGSLPAGMNLSSNGTLSGTPTEAGAFNFTVQAKDANNVIGTTSSISLTVNAPTITVAPAPGAIANPQVGVPYSQQFSASGGTKGSGYTFSISGSVPVGLSLSSSGVLSGTPTSATSSANFTVTATDNSTGTGAPFSGSQSYTVSVAAPTLSMSPASGTTLTAATQGSSYSQQFTASGGTAPYTYQVTGGTLPNGLSLANGGQLSGTPTQAGTYNFTVTAYDSSTGTGSPFSVAGSYTLNVQAIAPVANPVSDTVSYGSSSNMVPTSFSGGTPTSVAIASAASHGTATANGTTITYTPTSGYTGTDSFTYTGTNSAGTSAPATISMTISGPTLAITSSSGGTSLTATVGQSFTQTFTFSGGKAPYQGYSITGIPAGLSVTGFNNTSITVSGTPTVSGAFQLTVKGTDSSTGNGPFTVSQKFGLNVASATLAMSPSTVPGATAGMPYTQTFSTSGGISPYTYTVTIGALPTGLSLSASGILKGTPTTTGNYNFTITSTDSSTGAGSPAKTQTAYTLTVSAPSLTVTPANLPSATGGSAYSQTLSASGGTAPYNYAVITGSLPAGMSLSSNGALSGTPMALGNFPFTVTTTDSLGFTGTKAYTLTVASANLTLTPASLPGITADVAYKQTLSTSGGIAPYSYVVTAGALPAGLSLSSGGVLSGTATASGNFSFTVTATDSIGAIGTHAYSVTVIARPDPSKDPEVLGILNAQAQATRTLVRGQIDNFNNRLEQLHQGGLNVFENNLHVSLVQPQRLWAPEAALDPSQRYLAYDTNRVVSDAPPPNAQPPASSGQASTGPLSFWVGGGISIGSLQERNNTLGMDLHTSGLSMGVDTRVSDKAVIGAGLGYGQGHVDIGNYGSENRSRAYNVAVYGSLNPAPSLYLDGVVGYQRLSFDSTRYITNVGGTVTGTRHGNQMFGSFSLSQEGQYGAVYLAPYGRFDVASARLDAYTEQGNALYALHYERQTVRTVSGAAGVRAHWDIVRHSWQFQPMLRVEYRHDFQGNGVAMMRYADLNSGPLYLATLDDRSSNNWMAGVGLRVRNHLGQSLSVEYQDQIQRGGRHGQTRYLQLNLKIPY